jgi:hypothetical protein
MSKNYEKFLIFKMGPKYFAKFQILKLCHQKILKFSNFENVPNKLENVPKEF